MWTIANGSGNQGGTFGISKLGQKDWGGDNLTMLQIYCVCVCVSTYVCVCISVYTHIRGVVYVCVRVCFSPFLSLMLRVSLDPECLQYTVVNPSCYHYSPSIPI